MDDPAVRPASAADMPAVRRLARVFDLLDTWPDPPDFLDLERGCGRLVVAGDGGAVAGFAGTLPRGELTHLGDLFVDPAAQSAGLGGRLLGYTLPGDGRPTVTYASADPRAHALYARHGMHPVESLLYLAGRPHGLPAPATAPEPADPASVAALDATISGGARPAHLAWYAGRPGVAVWTVPGGYALTRTVDRTCAVGPAGGHDPAAALEAVLAAVAYGTRGHLAVQVAVFRSHPAAAALLAAGLRITDEDTFMATDQDLVATDRYVPHPDLG
jgi:GNAT superfamily N-acetyltransferase